MLTIGETAPDFSLTDASGNQITLSRFRGQKVVVYFYPKVSPKTHAEQVLQAL